MFECEHNNKVADECDICKGAGYVRGDHNLVKFFEYVIGFKCKTLDSYKHKQLPRKNHNDVNKFCNDFYNKTGRLSNNLRCTAGAASYKLSTTSRKKTYQNMTSSLSMGPRLDPSERLSNCERSSYKSSRRCNKNDVISEINSMVVH